MDFFTELAPFMQPNQLISVTVADILNNPAALSGYRSFVLADFVPTLPADDAATFYTRLQQFVQSGGNLVLTDGSLSALTLMGVVPAGQVSKTNFYAGFISFTNDGGTTTTYADPLAFNVNQAGAAEGSGHRHQTYEPVPIGMDIGDRSSCSGALCTAPIWTVGQTAWTTAGGRTVGQTTNVRTAFGELTLGQGRIRIIGALVPMPAEQYYHPFGLASYAVTYSGYQVLKNALQWGPPTAVRVVRFGAERTPRGAVLSWRTANESRLAGFNVWRGQAKLNRALILAKQSGRVSGASYRFVDRGARAGVAHTYRLQAVMRNGSRAWVRTATLRARR